MRCVILRAALWHRGVLEGGNMMTALVVSLLAASMPTTTSADSFVWRGTRVPVVARQDVWVVETPVAASDRLAQLLDAHHVTVLEVVRPQHRQISLLDVAGLGGGAKAALHTALAGVGVFLLPVRSHLLHEARPSVLLDRFVLARFATPMSAEELASLGKTLGFSVERQFHFATGVMRLETVDARAALTLANRLTQAKQVRYAQPDLLVRPQLYAAAPVDDFFAAQWHLASAPGIGAVTAWAQTWGSSSVVVAVADTGVEMDHPEFTQAGKLLFPLDVYDDDTDPTPPPTSDAEAALVDGHGTSCAGLVAAPANVGGASSGGSIGVCPDCSLMPIRLGPGSGFWSLGTLVTVFDHVRENGAQVMSNSWGLGPFYLPEMVYDALDATVAAGVSVFFAAGNGAGTVAPRDLVSSPGVIAIAGVSQASEHVSYSDAGPAVDLAAPTMEVADQIFGCPDGPGIETTDMTGSAGFSPQMDDLYSGFLCGADCTVHDDYTCFFSGTSASCPIAAGAGGLLLSAQPGLSPDLLRYVLAHSADKVGNAAYDGAGWNDQLGYGRVNLPNALALAADPGCSPIPEIEAACADHLDNDCDTFVDEADPDCGFVFPKSVDSSALGQQCTPSAYAEDEVHCGFDLGCMTLGEPSMFGGSSGICLMACESTCPDGQACLLGSDGAGYCLPTCASGSGCPSGFSCAEPATPATATELLCLITCRSANDCPSDITCNTATHVCGGIGGGDDGDGGDSEITHSQGAKPTPDASGCSCRAQLTSPAWALVWLALARRKGLRSRKSQRHCH